MVKTLRYKFLLVFLKISLRWWERNSFRIFTIDLAKRLILQRLSRQKRPALALQEQIKMSLALVNSIARGYRENLISENMVKKIVKTLLFDSILSEDTSRQINAYVKRHKRHAPYFLTISPGHKCNLRCKGCYAASTEEDKTLPWDIFDRVVTEAKDMWNTRFFVISGGEPLMYHSQEKDLLSIIEKHNDCFFLMYTNGLLLDDERCERISKAGNLTPAISVEGMRELTDERRGPGVFDEIVKVMVRLRKYKIAFGLSMTITSKNCHEILSDEFIEFFFHKHGAIYGWIFHYMPMGRIDFDLMITPQQRLDLRRRTWEVVEKENIFLVDFWNHGAVSNGCISAGRSTGYLHINWNGDVAPCVFVPYAPINIIEWYNKGKTLDDVLECEFFETIRAWQDNYGYQSEEDEQVIYKRWLRPCPIRDHYKTFHKFLKKYKPKPTDKTAKEMLTDKTYYKKMVEFGEELEKLVNQL